MADAVVSSGMKEAGYEYINLDGVPPPPHPHPPALLSTLSHHLLAAIGKWLFLLWWCARACACARVRRVRAHGHPTAVQSLTGSAMAQGWLGGREEDGTPFPNPSSRTTRNPHMSQHFPSNRCELFERSD